MNKQTQGDETYDLHRPETFDLGVRETACELIALFFADKPVHQLVAKHNFEGILMNYSEYRDGRIIKLLIEIATAFRVTSWRLRSNKEKKNAAAYVGMLFEGEDSDGVSLTMHEACNKIIHADEFAFEMKDIRGARLAYLKGNIIVGGMKGKREWTASLWIPEFCNIALLMPDAGTDVPLLENRAQPIGSCNRERLPPLTAHSLHVRGK